MSRVAAVAAMCVLGCCGVASAMPISTAYRGTTSQKCVPTYFGTCAGKKKENIQLTVTGSKLIQVYLNVNWKGNKNCTYLDGPDPSGYANFYRYSFTSPALKIKHGEFDGKMKETGTTRNDHYSASIKGTIRGTNVTGSINASFTGLLRRASGTVKCSTGPVHYIATSKA